MSATIIRNGRVIDPANKRDEADRPLRRRPAGAVRGGDRLHGPDPARAHADADPGAAGLVPLLVAAGLLIGRLPSYLRREVHPSRVAFVLPDAFTRSGRRWSWPCWGPRTSASTTGRCWPSPSLRRLVFDPGFTGLRIWLALGTPPQMQLRLFAWVLTVDAALAPVGILAGVAGQHQPLAVVLVLPIMGLLAFFARERRAHIDKALALVARLPRHRAAHERPARGRRRLHRRRAQPRRGGARPGRRRRPRPRRARPAQPRVRRAAARHRQDPRARRDHQQAGQARPTRSGRSSSATRSRARRCSSASAACWRRSGSIVRAHHERWDGGGYPDGLAGEAIPLAARIICACDAYSAMTTDRPYRAAMPVADAVAELGAAPARSSTRPWSWR